MSDVLARTAKLLEELGHIDQGATIVPETTFESLNFDSLDDVEMVMSAETEFGIEISDDDAEAIKTVGDFVRIVENGGSR